MADIFSETLKKLNEELGGNPIQKSLDEAANAGQAAPKKEDPKAAVSTKKPAADPLANLSTDELKKKLAELDEKLLAAKKAGDATALLQDPQIASAVKGAKEVGQSLMNHYTGLGESVMSLLGEIIPSQQNASQ